MPVGAFPAVLGHEGVGIVKEVGSQVRDRDLASGDIVVLSFNYCRECRACKAERLGACSRCTEINFTMTARHGPDARSPISLLDGTPVHGQFFGQSSLSKMAIVAQNSVVKIEADERDLPYLAPLACGYLTGAGTVINVLDPKPDHKLAILGMGAVGLAALMAAKSIGVDTIVAVDLVDQKLQKATRLGASHTLNTKTHHDVNEGIRATFPEGVDMILDTTGVVPLLESGVRALAHEGTLAMVGVPPPATPLQIDSLDFLTTCKKMIGVIEGFANPQKVCTVTLVPHLLGLYKQGRFPVDQLATVYGTEDLELAIEGLKSGDVGVIKPILSWADCS
ncbi:zinc-binding dehydrogenase domain-containing protein [Sarocladium implicatum]|nr:zinc-binding dehydrogenase domain-containing protein [Sarocladium implicatum]